MFQKWKPWKFYSKSKFSAPFLLNTLFSKSTPSRGHSTTHAKSLVGATNLYSFEIHLQSRGECYKFLSDLAHFLIENFSKWYYKVTFVNGIDFFGTRMVLWNTIYEKLLWKSTNYTFYTPKIIQWNIIQADFMSN